MPSAIRLSRFAMKPLSSRTRGALLESVVPSWLNDLTYSRLFAWCVHWPLLVAGAVVFRLTRRTPWLSYWSMRRLYCITRGDSNRWLTRILGHAPVVPAAQGGGVLGDMPPGTRATAIDQLHRDGFVVLGQLLGEADLAGLVGLARATPARLVPAPKDGPREACFDEKRPLAIKYDLPEGRLIEHPVAQKLLADDSLRAFARAYLGCEPVNDLVAMWWSTAVSPKANSEVAQLYHFDMDRPQFLKIFVYLTDVDSDTGPHCFIRGSHRERADALWRDGRHDDAEILSYYPPDREVEITAPKGTVIAVDTSGFHKGKPLLRGHRLLLQLEYASSLFGTVYETMRVPAVEPWESGIVKAPHFFSRFSLS
jgi:hypothetical protein